MAGDCMEPFLVALISAAFDDDEAVRQQIAGSLRELGRQCPQLVLTSCRAFLSSGGPRLAQGHRLALLQSMAVVAADAAERIERPLALEAIAAAAEAMTEADQASPQCQEAGSEFLVALGRGFVDEVLQEMLEKIKPGALPHPMVIKTLANLSVTNVYLIVPLLPVVLTALLPAFSLAKDNSSTWALVSAASLFSKSISEYLTHLDKAPDPSLSLETFSQPIYTVYKVHLSAWLQQRDAKLRAAILEALGHMVQLLPPARLEAELPTLVPQILALYRKQPEHLPVTQCLHSVLGAAVAGHSRALRGQTEQLLGTLHHQLCAPVDCDDQPALKNRSQLLGCFALLARAAWQQSAQFLIRKVAGTSGHQRAASLMALKRLVDTLPAPLHSKKHQIMAGLKMALLDEDKAVKKMVLLTIGSLANRGYLELPGGRSMVRYVVGLCAISCQDGAGRPRGSDADEVTGGDLSTMAETLLDQLTAMEDTVNVLWPTLLQCVTPAPFTNALPAVCRSLENLAGKQRELGTEHSLGDGPGLPSPQALLGRLLAASSVPYGGRGRGIPALRLLLVLSSTVHPAVETLWAEQLPELLQYLRGNSEDSLPHERWEEKLALFLSGSLETIADERWTSQLNKELLQQVGQLHSYPRERGFLYQCSGVALKQMKSKAAVRTQLQEMLQSVQYHQASEREGAALGIGLCATAHLDTTLAQLEAFARCHLARNAESLFDVMKERLDGEAENVRGMLLLCYGQVAWRAPVERVLPRVDTDILGRVIALGHKAESKDVTVKLSLAKAVTLIAQTILANGQRQVCTRKGELLTCMQELIKAEPTDQLKTPVRHSAMIACTYLVQLEPPSNEVDTFQLTRTCVDSVFGLLPLESQAGREDDWAERQSLLRETTAALQDLLNQILLRGLCPNGLQAVFKHMEGWITSRKDNERERAMDATSKLLVFFLENIDVRLVVTHYNLEAIVGRLIPRCADPLFAIRHLAIDSLYLLFHIQLRYEGFSAGQGDESVERLKTTKGFLDGVDHGTQLRTCADLTRVISDHMSYHQLSNLLPILCEGLTDPQPNCSSVVSAIINALLRERGAGLQDQVLETLRALHVQLRLITQEHVRFAVMRNIGVLASQNTATVVSLLLTYPVPFDQHTKDIWKSLAGEAEVGQSTLEFLLSELNVMIEREERRESSVNLTETRYTALKPIAVACALSEVLSNPESAPAIDSLYPQLFGTLLILCSCPCKPPKDLPCKSASKERRAAGDPISPENFDFCGYWVAMLEVLLSQGKNKEVVDSMKEKGGWAMMKNPDAYHEGVAMLAKEMASHASPNLDRLTEYLSAMLNIYQNQRIAMAAFLGEMVNHHVAFDLKHMDVLVSSLLRCLLDQSPTIRLLSIRGLGNVAIGDPTKTRRYSTKLLAAILALMEEPDESHHCITMEGLSGLSKILAQLEESNVRDILVNLALGIRPFFENRSDRVRAAALSVFGSMSKFAVGESKPIFVEQVHSSLVCLLLHLNDSSLEVSEACKCGLASVGPFLGSDNLNTTFQTEFAEDTNHDYWAFLSKLTRIIVCDLPDYTNTYLTSSMGFCSNWSPEIRANAVIFAGHLLKNMPKENVQFLADDNIPETIISMIRDPAPSVRMTTAKTLSLFC